MPAATIDAANSCVFDGNVDVTLQRNDLVEVAERATHFQDPMLRLRAEGPAVVVSATGRAGDGDPISKVVADTLMLSLIARSSGKPEWSAVLGVLAGASFTVWLASPSQVRRALLEMPILAVTMATVVLGHVAWATARASRVVNREGVDRRERWVSAASEIFPLSAKTGEGFEAWMSFVKSIEGV